MFCFEKEDVRIKAEAVTEMLHASLSIGDVSTVIPSPGRRVRYRGGNRLDSMGIYKKKI